MFQSIQMAPDDPILGLSEIYDADERKNKINLGIGVYIDKTKNTPVLTSVKQAEEWLLKHEISKNYLNIEGLHSFNTATQNLLFGSNANSIVSEKRMRTVQTPGGTGALRIAAEFIVKNTKSKRIWISSPTWINHRNIFLAAGLSVYTYPYYNNINHSLNFDELYSSLQDVQPNDVVLFHCCCHNPTGIDPNTEQWSILSELSEKQQWLPLFDLAYQGFSHGLKEDLEGLYIFCKKNPELIVCNSYSKNFGLYNERIGACTVITNNNDDAERALSQLRVIIRGNYSNPPAHGASIVSLILNNKILRSTWESELKNMREHIKHMRKLLANTLQTHDKNKDFSFIKRQCGMFSFIGLKENQVIRLREQFGIYLVGAGRINLSGLSEDNIDYVSKAIIKTYKKAINSPS
ncbi:aspartate/tyrosine/aromatic aminotransferase [Blochmannia endosymbiont of Camponotus sp. C-003]|uniref:amino acid aminotransferase n=1 Tax=unclassified Candidatus Blochmanniella TaxID=711328 RepID=UPI0020243F8C|nr:MULTISPECIES: amino acid aminotransferase [unclassified Candidatus Blochmannia]URJ23402.1 aspartate/tyrosine/aromatic aminotransferase [Blochmannia endosymbiont of Camponotus sp. C-003]URJ28875.1 aspartate/tyrosine/aromatic aminotransferase [Blochmannia endosymbiont of Camponotus sp. C-046]